MDQKPANWVHHEIDGIWHVQTTPLSLFVQCDNKYDALALATGEALLYEAREGSKSGIQFIGRLEAHAEVFDRYSARGHDQLLMRMAGDMRDQAAQIRARQ